MSPLQAFPTLIVILVGLLTKVALASPAQAQSAYFAANGQSSVVPWTNGLLGVDFTEAKLSLNFVEPVLLTCLGEGCVSDQINLSLHMSGAARKGQRDLTGTLDFVPGFDLGGGIAYVARGSGQGHNIFFLRTTYTTQQRDIIVSDIQAGTSTIDDESQRSFVVTVGINRGFSRRTVVGLALEGRREISTPGAQLAQEICTPGRSVNGIGVLVCSNRFVGPLPNLWAGQLRADMNLALTNVAATSNTGLSLVAAGSLDLVETANAAVNFALGPAISLAAYPGQPVAILIIGVRDAFDSNPPLGSGTGSYLGNHLLVRLGFSIPFKILVGNP